MPRIFPEYSPIATPRERSVFLDPPVYGKNPAFDFNTGEFRLTPSGGVLMASGKEALVEWIRKTLVTPRFAHGIYPSWYGSELQHSMAHHPGHNHGTPTDSMSVIGDIEKEIKEALTVDRRVIDVHDFSSTFEEDRVLTTFTVVTTLGDIADITAVTEI